MAGVRGGDRRCGGMKARKIQSVGSGGGREENALKTCLRCLKWREAALRLVSPLAMSRSEMNRLGESRLFEMDEVNPNDSHPVSGRCSGDLVGHWVKPMIITHTWT